MNLEHFSNTWIPARKLKGSPNFPTETLFSHQIQIQHFEQYLKKYQMILSFTISSCGYAEKPQIH